jgi:hypothetical protein
MLDISRLQYTNIIELALDASVDPTESGLAMVRGADALGNEVMLLSGGTNADQFVGFLYLDKHASTLGTRYGYALQVPSTSPLTVVLPDTTSITNMVFFNQNGAVAGADFTVSGNQVTFVAAHAGESMTVNYNYQLTPMQQAMLGISPIPSASAFIRKAAIFRSLTRLYVNNFKANDTYTVGTAIKLLAGGFVGTSGAGNQCGVCISVPSAADPFLGIEYNV